MTGTRLEFNLDSRTGRMEDARVFADPDVSTFFHAFCFDLQRDSKGYLYYAKSGQYTDFKQPDQSTDTFPNRLQS